VLDASARDMKSMSDTLATLCDTVLRSVARGENGLPRVGMVVAREAGLRNPTIYRPMLCIVLQGVKEVMIGDRTLRYDTASYFISSVDVPASGCVVEGSADKPYVAVTLALDGNILADLIADAGGPIERNTAGFAVAAMTPELLDAWGRMLRLLDRPAEAPVLAPLIEREILFRLLQGPQGPLIRQAARVDSRLSQIREAIAWIRAHYAEPLSAEHLAGIAGMSMASFNRHFRAVTAMSPLQYQKALRLQEARRLLIASSNAARTAYAVGYESPSQFSREYGRMFGVPPARDAVRMRQLEVVDAA
jgi:AraC-like DNA-binding protein